MDKIIASKEDLLNGKCPIRPECHSGSENELNICIEVAPSGQVGRSEPATLSGSSIYTDDKIHMSCGAEPPPTTFFEKYKARELEVLNEAASESKKQSFEREALEDPRNISLFNQKFAGYDVTIEELFKGCQEYYFPKGGWVGSVRFYGWINSARLDKHRKKESVKESNSKPMSMFTEEERELLASYKQAIRLNVIDKFFTTEKKLKRAKEIFERERTLIANNTRMQNNPV
jgi:hypothetical protein